MGTQRRQGGKIAEPFCCDAPSKGFPSGVGVCIDSRVVAFLAVLSLVVVLFVF